MYVESKTNREGELLYTAYCLACGHALEICGDTECANGAFAEAIAKRHAEDTGHKVIVGFTVQQTSDTAKKHGL